MQLTEKAKALRVNPVNVSAVKNASTKKLADTPYFHILLLLAEACDSNARDINCYITLGATKKGDAITLSINLDGDRQTLYSSSFADLASDCAAIHDAP